VANGIGHREDGKTKGEGDPEEADTQFRIGCRENGAPAAAKDQPKSPQTLRSTSTHDIHGFFLLKTRYLRVDDLFHYRDGTILSSRYEPYSRIRKRATKGA